MVVVLKQSQFSLPDVQRDVSLPSCMHATSFSIYQQSSDFVPSKKHVTLHAISVAAAI